MKPMKLVFLCLVLLSFVFSQEKITEKVTVDWWVLPVFAIDSRGESVLDLQKNDITLRINNREIDQFHIYKQSYTDVNQKSIQKNPIAKKKIIFLLFDSTLSTSQSIDRSKLIARQIVDNAENNHRFIIMNIEPFTGLKFVGGPVQNKALVLEIIKEKIKGRSSSRTFNVSDFIASTSSDKAGKYSDKNVQEVFRPGVERFTKHKSMTFFQSFQLLYYALNSIKDNKFIYLFTEGISKTTQTSGKHMQSAYRRYLAQMAGYLGRSSAVLFIINPSGTTDSDSSMTSGEDSLRFLAKESGGRYFEGSNDSIKTEIENIHRAYYEIAFPDLKGVRGGIRRITVNSKRSGVSIHTLRSLEKNKTYSNMNPVEKEILALNLLNQNSIFKIGLSVENLQIVNTIRKNNQIIHTVTIPDQLINRQLDLFKVWVDRQTRDAAIEKQTVVPGRNQLDIRLDDKKGKESHFVLINGALNLALARVVKKVEPAAVPDKKPEPLTSPLDSPELVPTEKIVYDAYLTNILNEMAVYCKKLQNSAFHFICKEKVVEIRDELDVDYKSTPGRDYGDRYLAREGMDTKSRKRNQIVNKYRYDYQLIKDNGKIAEQRLSMKGEKNDLKARDIESRMITFFSKKIVLAPIILLSREWQTKYRYEFIGKERIKRESMIVVKATPLNPGQNNFLFGTIWIDSGDFSVRKIRVNPRSIRGYAQLLQLASKFKAKLTLSAEIDFGKLTDGIRFPSEVTVIENYRGGPLITRLRGKKGWNRSKTVYSYKDYRFFNVQTEVRTD